MLKSIVKVICAAAFFGHQAIADIPVTRNCRFSTPTENASIGSGSSSLVVSALSNRKCLLIVNKGSATVYITFASGGGATDGVPIPAGGNWEPTVVPFNAIYARAASGTQTVLVVEGQ